MDDDWTPSVRTAVRYYEQNLDWTAIPDAFAGGTSETSATIPQPRQCLAASPCGFPSPERTAVRKVPTVLTHPN